MRFACALLCAIVVAACDPFAQPAPRITREPEATFQPLVGSDAQVLVERAVAATYAVAYAVSGTLEGRMMSGTWTTYQRPPYIRLDLRVEGAGGSVDFRSYIGPAGVVVCDMTVPTCRLADDAVGPDASASNLLARKPGDYTVVTRERLVVAQEQTRCFLFRPNTGVEASFKEAYMCYADDGVPLVVEMDLADGSSFSLEGRIVKRTVRDDELLPPAGR